MRHVCHATSVMSETLGNRGRGSLLKGTVWEVRCSDGERFLSGIVSCVHVRVCVNDCARFGSNCVGLTTCMDVVMLVGDVTG